MCRHALIPPSLHIGILVSAVALVSAGDTFGAQASFQLLPLPGGTVYSAAHGVSEDGTRIVGEAGGAGGRQATVWGQSIPPFMLGGLPGELPLSAARGISGDGNVVVGWATSAANVVEGFMWTSGAGMTPLSALSGASTLMLSHGEAVDRTGALIGGYSYDQHLDEATIWTAPATPQSIALHPLNSISFVHDVARAQPVVVGALYGLAGAPGGALVWTQAAGSQLLNPPGSTGAEATAVSGDGETVFIVGATIAGRSVYRWRAGQGFHHTFDLPAGTTGAAVLAADDGGDIAVGWYELGGTRRGFHWSLGAGFASFRELLVMRGATGFQNREPVPHGLSADGHIIVGVLEPSAPSQEARAFMATLAPAAPGTLGSDVCAPSNPNSTGASPTLDAFGSPAVGSDDVVLSARDLPARSFGMVLVSDVQGFVPGYNGSAGDLCLGGAVSQFRAPGQVRGTGPYGELALRVSTGALPSPGGPISIQPGQTWIFQLWYRDVGTSNLTSARSITFS